MKYLITPVPKPRMTQSDKWKKRPVVLKYFAFKDEIIKAGVVLNPEGQSVTFHIPMPKSWSKKKKTEMEGQYHKQRPDLDNYFKALGDAVYDDDSLICDVRMSKKWAYIGSIEIKEIKQ